MAVANYLKMIISWVSAAPWYVGANKYSNVCKRERKIKFVAGYCKCWNNFVITIQ